MDISLNQVIHDVKNLFYNLNSGKSGNENPHVCMRKLIFGFLLLLVVNHHASAQLYKGQWMAGGNVSVTTYNNYFFKYNSMSATVVPNVGYFFVDKLAGGLDFYVNWGETQFSYNFTTYGFSPLS